MAAAEALRDVPEIGADVLEHELAHGRRVAVLDVRSREDHARWAIAPGAAALVSVPEQELVADPAAALAQLPAALPLRVLCTAGVASRRATHALLPLRPDAVSVRGGMLAWSRLLVQAEVRLDGTSARVLQLRRQARGCLSYVVAAGGQALVVDPGLDPEPYVRGAAQLGARVAHVLDTHVHADHLSGAAALAAATGAERLVPRGSLARGLDGTGLVALGDGEELRLGEARLRALALPGHTTDMMGVLVDGAALIGGDSVFLGAVARPDLEQGRGGADELARTLHRTLRARVLDLPETTLLLPGHYQGGRVDGPLARPLGAVWAGLPELVLDEDAFVAQVVAGLPAPPANHAAIIDVNLGAAVAPDVAARLEVCANACAAR